MRGPLLYPTSLYSVVCYHLCDMCVIDGCAAAGWRVGVKGQPSHTVGRAQENQRAVVVHVVLQSRCRREANPLVAYACRKGARSSDMQIGLLPHR
jgi:hypothetical protein